MPRLTRRELAAAWNSQAPEGMERPVPEKRKAKAGQREWKLQVACVKLCREAERVNKHFAFITSQAENRRDPKRAGIAKAMGLQAGFPDLMLMRRQAGGVALCLVELKLPGGKLRPEQEGWFEWFKPTGTPCHLVTTVEQFAAVLGEFLG